MFCDLLGEERVLTEEPMKLHTTFRIGGPADLFLVPETEAEVSEIIKICRNADMPYFILGNGSNLLVGDGGYRGVVIQVYKNMDVWYMKKHLSSQKPDNHCQYTPDNSFLIPEEVVSEEVSAFHPYFRLRLKTPAY